MFSDWKIMLGKRSQSDYILRNWKISLSVAFVQRVREAGQKLAGGDPNTIMDLGGKEKKRMKSHSGRDIVWGSTIKITREGAGIVRKKKRIKN